MKSIIVAPEDDGIRLDRWFSRHMPGVTHGLLRKALRKGWVKIGTKRPEAGYRLKKGEEVRVAGIIESAEKPERESEKPVRGDIVDWVIYKDPHVIAINKPPGIAVQGGSKITESIDGMLIHLKFEKRDKPKLVHRLDKDTSGVLLLARSADVAAKLSEVIRRHEMKKTYWALVAGVPKPKSGVVNEALAKQGAREKMEIDEEGKEAVTEYRVLEEMGGKMAWLELNPITGRTHQLRAHCAFLGCPIIGDGKYGGKGAFVPGLAKKLHLHARRVLIPSFMGTRIDISAPPPEHMAELCVS